MNYSIGIAIAALAIGAAMDTWSLIMALRPTGPSGIVLTPLLFYGIGVALIWPRFPSGLVGASIIIGTVLVHVFCSQGVINVILRRRRR